MIFVLILRMNVINIIMIDIDIYCLTCKLRKALVFVIFIRNLEYQAKKRLNQKTDPKCLIPKKYQDFINVCSKKVLNFLFFY